MIGLVLALLSGCGDPPPADEVDVEGNDGDLTPDLAGGTVYVTLEPWLKAKTHNAVLFRKIVEFELGHAGYRVVRRREAADLIAQVRFLAAEKKDSSEWGYQVHLWDNRSDFLIAYYRHGPIETIVARDFAALIEGELRGHIVAEAFQTRLGVDDVRVYAYRDRYAGMRAVRPDHGELGERVFVDPGAADHELAWGDRDFQAALYRLVFAAGMEVVSQVENAEAILSVRWRREPFEFERGGMGDSITADLQVTAMPSKHVVFERSLNATTPEWNRRSYTLDVTLKEWRRKYFREEMDFHLLEALEDAVLWESKKPNDPSTTESVSDSADPSSGKVARSAID